MDATSIMEFVKEAVTTEVFGVWFLIGAALVFFIGGTASTALAL